MFSWHKLWYLLVMVILLENREVLAKSLIKAAAAEPAETSIPVTTQLPIITNDVISDIVEKDTKKVIRINPLDLPPLKDDANTLNMDSSLYKIQTLQPYNGKKQYTNIQRSKPTNSEVKQSYISDAPIIRGLSLLPNPEKTTKAKHQPKRKNLNFLFNQEDLKGNSLSKSMRVHVAPGAYPVYYVLAKTNGRFGKYPLKNFSSSQEFMKYLQKNKLQNLPTLSTHEKDLV